MRITRIDWARLAGQRPRAAGCNARLGVHGQAVSSGVARLWTDDGATGWGWSRIEPDAAEPLLVTDLDDAIVPTADASAPRGISPALRELEYPLLDLLAKREGLPVYRWLAGATAPPEGSLSVPCYDTSLYFDDLHLPREADAVACMVDEMRAGWERGHRAFKLKIGRGALHMPLEEGTQRDIAIVRAVRDAAGPDARLMCDANNGYNLNLLKRELSETADADVYWIEEPFHEDGTLYAHLKEWMHAVGLEVLIADGEGDASPRLLDWARDGLIDVVQHDILRPGFSHWLALGPALDACGARSAPHHYGEPLGNYYACHLAPGIDGFEAVEWDEASLDGVDASAYTICEGRVHLSPAPGFGLALDEDAFARRVREEGWSRTL